MIKIYMNEWTAQSYNKSDSFELVLESDSTFKFRIRVYKLPNAITLVNLFK